MARGPRSEAQVAKSPLYALKRNIPHFAKGHMLRFCSPEAVFATGRSGDSGPMDNVGFGGQDDGVGQHNCLLE